MSYWMVSSGIGFAQKIYACDAVVIDRSDNFVLIAVFLRTQTILISVIC